MGSGLSLRRLFGSFGFRLRAKFGFWVSSFDGPACRLGVSGFLDLNRKLVGRA